ncbi:long polar fimbrial protein LpfD [Enterobacter cloacae]|nr:long polar fimbrial protein LpfD [Enterobacter cloacae]
MFKKLTMIAGLLGGSALFSGQVLAAADWGPCAPDGGTHNFNALINQTITDTTMNVAGGTLPDFYSWNLGTSYQASCQCAPGVDNKEFNYFKAVSPLPAGYKNGSLEYYTLNSNIDILTSVYISGGVQEYRTVPFGNVSNEVYSHDDCDDGSGPKNAWTSGSMGQLSMYITHPFVGSLTIPSTKIVDIYATMKKGVYGSIPISSVYLSGNIVVPQGCELSSGSTLEIPFGEFKASDFKDRKGQIAKNATKFTKELQFKCTNISDGVKIFLHIEGMPNANDSNAIDMGNPDIGAVIEGANGKILVPNDTSVNQEMSVSALVDDTHRTASTTISAYPISTTGKLPAAGEFEGIATMRIDVE